MRPATYGAAVGGWWWRLVGGGEGEWATLGNNSNCVFSLSRGILGVLILVGHRPDSMEVAPARTPCLIDSAACVSGCSTSFAQPSLRMGFRMGAMGRCGDLAGKEPIFAHMVGSLNI